MLQVPNLPGPARRFAGANRSGGRRSASHSLASRKQEASRWRHFRSNLDSPFPLSPAGALDLYGYFENPSSRLTPPCERTMESDVLIPTAASPGDPEQPLFETRLENARTVKLGWPSRWLSAVSAAGETSMAFALNPGRAFAHFRFEGRALPPLVFATLLGAPSLFLDLALRALLAGDRLGGDWPAGKLAGLAILAPALHVYLMAQGIHLFLVLTGKVKASFLSTLRVCGYVGGSLAPLLIVPVLGETLYFIASAAGEGLGLKLAHDLSQRDAILAVVIPALALIIGLVAALAPGALWWSVTPR